MSQRIVSRRTMLAFVPAGLAAGALLAGCKPEESAAPVPATEADDAAKALAALEASAGGRLGVAFLDSASGRTTGHRLDERFALCSTFKWPLSAVVLHAIDAGKLTLDRRVPYTASDLMAHSPVTEEHVAKGALSAAELMQATIATSDNAAANLLLPLIGGPTGMTKQLRAWGDQITRLDRFEPEMNLVAKDDPRDTTIPAAMAALLRATLYGDALSPASRKLLFDWGAGTTTGAKRLRAGVPAGWQVANKTGTAMAPGLPSRYNDIAAIVPPGKPPVLVTAYYESGTPSEDMRDEDQAVLTAVARIAGQWVETT